MPRTVSNTPDRKHGETVVPDGGSGHRRLGVSPVIFSDTWRCLPSAIWRGLCSPSMIAECRHGTLYRDSFEDGA